MFQGRRPCEREKEEEGKGMGIVSREDVVSIEMIRGERAAMKIIVTKRTRDTRTFLATKSCPAAVEIESLMD